MADLGQARLLGAQENGLAVVVTTRADGSPHASVVNAGVLAHPATSEPVVGFVARGAVRKLVHLRRVPRASVVFRSGWDWVAVEGRTDLFGPADELDGMSAAELPRVLRTVYAAAVGGTESDWSGLDEAMAAERHTAVLITPDRVYSNAPE